MRHFRDFVHSIGFTLPPSLHFSSALLPDFHHVTKTYALDEESKGRLRDYMTHHTLYLDDFGHIDQGDFVLAFSFGDSDSTNQKLANVVDLVCHSNPKLDVCLQQEVAKHTNLSNATEISCQDYQTTFDVAQKAKLLGLGQRVVVVAQAWHAKRCIETCQSLGLDVVALRGVNHFPFDDPQPWVRNPINWVIKESHRELFSGVQVSQKYQLA
ncbi:YdcF family protein [Vibrio panuliri]|uniref:DUF218 domain-containing protein n=1 Tax=Vibrio panuliri TaxID=1381081 RepID=A0ABX3FUF6_9VIBR|nr:hypothetical protein [Vibrio panuliri]KAB1457115.1 YdcF family protein [Vibrio panuliri]OLQ96436.1 hypothetical protein BIY20_19010 [Vibrio panuliri]